MRTGFSHTVVIWFLFFVLGGGTLFYFHHQAAKCEKMRCPPGTAPRFFTSSAGQACVCEPVGWR